MAKKRTVNLDKTVLFKGVFYAPGQNVVVPDDFPDQQSINDRLAHAGQFFPLEQKIAADEPSDDATSIETSAE